jgi:serine/threonine protein kinase
MSTDASLLGQTLSHSLHDVGCEGDVRFLVTELIEGESLADRLCKGPLPVAERLRYGAKIADALEAAHRHGIVHRSAASRERA